MPNFSLIGLLISFWQTKQLPVGVVIEKHIYICFIMLTQLLGNHIPNLSMIGPLISFWQPKQFPAGVA